MRIVSWNLNGVRAACDKGLMQFVSSCGADVICAQETKASVNRLNRKIFAPDGYKSWWYSGEKSGYSGTAVWARRRPDTLRALGVDIFDKEGRTQVIQFDDIYIFNCYFPNARSGGDRLEYKMKYCRAVTEQACELAAAGNTVIVGGDFNLAHKPYDIDPVLESYKHPGYFQEEREWLDAFVEKGWTDTFRMFEPGPKQYTWWSYRLKGRAKNIGWRLDYFFINNESLHRVKRSGLLTDVMGSDHCPIVLELY